MDGGQAQAAALAREWRDLRGALVALAGQLSETRLSRATARAGWTVRHELAHTAALDRDIAHVLERAASGVAEAVDEAREAVDLRRMRGQAMLAAQDLRLVALREYLAATGERTALAIEAQAALLERPMRLAGREATTVAGHLDHALARAREAIAVLREAAH